MIRGPGLLEPLAPLPDAVVVLRREYRPDPARQRCAKAAEGGQRGQPVGRAPRLKVRILWAEHAEPAQAAPEGRPRLLQRPRQHARPLCRVPQPAQDLPEGPLDRLDARQWAGHGLPRVAPLLRAEAHLPKQLVRAPAAEQVWWGQREGGPGREGVQSDVRAGQGEETFLRG